MHHNPADDYRTSPDIAPWTGVPHNMRKYALSNPLPPYPMLSDVVSTTIHRILSDLRGRHATGTEPRIDVETLAAFATALTIAAEQFVNDVRGTATRPSTTASQAFGDLGFAQAVRGEPLSPLLICLAIVVRRAWQSTSGWAIRKGWDTSGLSLLGNSAFAFAGHLEQQLASGYQTGSLIVSHQSDAVDPEPHPAGEATPPGAARTPDVVTRQPAEPIVVMRVAFHGKFPEPHRLGRAMVLGSVNPALVVVPAADAEAFAKTLIRSPGLRVAMSWPVPPTLAAAANQWAYRALELVDKTVIPRQPIIHCDKHTTQLWLHAEPQLRRFLVQKHLGPLLAEGRNSRQILGETLLAWVSGRDRAPAIAAHLGVHPHTVRYRLKRINELFGDSLHDPAFMEVAAILLQATVPLWKAGDESDVLEYRAARRQEN